MIIVGLVANIDFLNAGFFGNLLQVFGEQLTLLVKVVSGSLRMECKLYCRLKKKVKRKQTYHINKYIQRTLPFLQKFRSVMFLPLFHVLFTKVAAKGLLAPGAVNRVAYGRKGGHGLVFAWVLEELYWGLLY